jgi:hypothetical protein
MKISFFSLLAAAGVLVQGNALPRGREPSLSVKISSLSFTTVKGEVTNIGRTAVRLLNVGTILDPHPIRKFQVFADGSPPMYNGLEDGCP